MSVLLAVAVIVVCMLALAWFGQRRMMYFPFADVPPPAVVGLADAEPIEFDTADGLTLGGWFVRGGPASAPTVLVFNGNAGHRAYRAMLARGLADRGLSVLLFDYRGFGGNPGAPTEDGLLADARAAHAWIAGRADVDPSRLVYFGESLGAAVAATLAVESPPAALVLRSPFTSMADVGSVHYPLLPVRWLLRDRYATVDRIGRLRCPLLVIAGDRDAIVPVEQSRKLYEAATVASKRLAIIPGTDHNDAALVAGPVVIEAVVSFVNATLPSR